MQLHRAGLPLVLYFEFCAGGDLSDFVSHKRNSEYFIWSVFLQLAEALAFLLYGDNRRAKSPDTPPAGWEPVLHLDVKPANIFLRRRPSSRDPYPDVVLGDFGLATVHSVARDCGTWEWIGPEIGQNRLTAKSDVWGLGAVIHTLAHGYGPVDPPPRSWRGESEDWYDLPSARHVRPMPPRYSDKLNDNLIDCLAKSPSNRVSSDRLVRHLLEDRPKGQPWARNVL